MTQAAPTTAMLTYSRASEPATGSPAMPSPAAVRTVLSVVDSHFDQPTGRTPYELVPPAARG